MKFCCRDLENNCTILHSQKKKVIRLFVYQPKFRGIGIATSDDGAFLPISYCPFCGKKQLPDLCDKYWETVIAELGEEYYWTSENYNPNRPLPLEFQTSGWWRKRGL